MIKNRALIFFRSGVLKPFFKAIQSYWKSQMCDIKRAIFAESEVKTKKKRVFTSGIHIFQRVCWVIFYYYFMILCIFHPLWMSTKRNQATQKSFQATQLWVEAHRLRTMNLDCSNYSYTSKFFVNYILYLLLKQKQTQTLNQPRTLLCKQTKKKKMVWQQQQITVTELPKIFFKVYFFVLFFCYFCLIIN